jgi:acylphosphatase
MQITHLNIRISGKVQGVFYRASAKSKAEELHLKGFVRNERNGDVYIEAEGDETNLKEFVEWCRKGPAHANVANVEVNFSDLRNFKKFEISR